MVAVSPSTDEPLVVLRELQHARSPGLCISVCRSVGMKGSSDSRSGTRAPAQIRVDLPPASAPRRRHVAHGNRRVDAGAKSSRGHHADRIRRVPVRKQLRPVADRRPALRAQPHAPARRTVRELVAKFSRRRENRPRGCRRLCGPSECSIRGRPRPASWSHRDQSRRGTGPPRGAGCPALPGRSSRHRHSQAAHAPPPRHATPAG